MTTKPCAACGEPMDPALEKCPNCGAPNTDAAVTFIELDGVETPLLPNGTPRTIAELRALALDQKLPLDKMRVFIGENYQEPRAFGIYEEDGRFIVYKNKNDGSRSIRYEGEDEAFAVNELYEKMCALIEQHRNQTPAPADAEPAKPAPLPLNHPQTIEELREYARRMQLPLDKMHMHIGENYLAPRAFGIYEADGIFIVYKNKDDGTRAIRYQGPNEAYAVNELYQKMRTLMREHSQSVRSRREAKSKNPLSFVVGIFVLITVFLRACTGEPVSSGSSRSSRRSSSYSSTHDSRDSWDGGGDWDIDFSSDW